MMFVCAHLLKYAFRQICQMMSSRTQEREHVGDGAAGVYNYESDSCNDRATRIIFPRKFSERFNPEVTRSRHDHAKYAGHKYKPA